MNDWTQAEVTNWTQAEINALMAERDAAIRERDEALALAKERDGELALCWCVATDSSPDDAPDPSPAGMAYKAVDAMQDREYAVEARALKAEAERDAAIAILRLFVDAEETAKTSSKKSLGEYVDAMVRARKLLGQQ